MTATIYGDPIEVTLQALTNAKFNTQVETQSSDVKKGLFHVLRSLASSQRSTGVEEEQASWDAIYDEYKERFEAAKSGDLEGLTERESLHLRTAIMREHTAEDLKRQLNDALTVLNCPVVEGKDGTLFISDHAVLSNNGVNIVNNMHLEEPVEFVHTGDDAFVPRGCPVWEAVSGIVDAAKAFPVTPRHIVVSVSGPGLDEIEGNAFVANKYVSAATGNLEPTPCQVIFLPHRDLLGWLNATLTTHNSQDPNSRPVPAEEILANSRVVVLNGSAA